jgi:hypothetical protein
MIYVVAAIVLVLVACQNGDGSTSDESNTEIGSSQESVSLEDSNVEPLVDGEDVRFINDDGYVIYTPVIDGELSRANRRVYNPAGERLDTVEQIIYLATFDFEEAMILVSELDLSTTEGRTEAFRLVRRANGVVGNLAPKSTVEMDVMEFAFLEVKELHTPPANLFDIDSTLADPSNEDITFWFNGLGLLLATTYMIDGYSFTSTYSYRGVDSENDDSMVLEITIRVSIMPMETDEEGQSPLFSKTVTLLTNLTVPPFSIELHNEAQAQHPDVDIADFHLGVPLLWGLDKEVGWQVVDGFFIHGVAASDVMEVIIY